MADRPGENLAVDARGGAGVSTLPDAQLFELLKDCIERERKALDTGQGIKFLYSDVRSLSNPFWTIGLNPGGGHIEEDQWCREDGKHDYRDGYKNRDVVELRGEGGLKLREQLNAMVQWLGIDWAQTLSFNLVPFRSQEWRKIPRDQRRRAIRFASEKLWPLLRKHRTPSLIVSFARPSADVFRELFSHISPPRAFPVGWGKITADLSESAELAIVRLPHLSRYRIFDREIGAAPLEALRAALKRWLPEQRFWER
jgi:hypothetical protein